MDGQLKMEPYDIMKLKNIPKQKAVKAQSRMTTFVLSRNSQKATTIAAKFLPGQTVVKLILNVLFYVGQLV